MIGGHVDPTLVAAPVFLLALLAEMAVARRRQARGDDLAGFTKRDTWASLWMGIGSLFFVGLIHLVAFVFATWLWNYRLIDLGTGVLGWTVAIVGWDFLYYWHHRWEHTVRLLWAAHVNHHSSQKFNFSTALRQSWTTWPSALMYPLLALVGVRPWMILTSEGINLIFQFWVHTELVEKLPRWYEWVFNTPSHHRVHHGSDLQYLDRNYAGILMWDRVFGTFEPEDARVTYGLTKNIATYNPFRIAFHEYVAMWDDVRSARGWRARLGYVFGPPAWTPDRSSATTATATPIAS